MFDDRPNRPAPIFLRKKSQAHSVLSRRPTRSDPSLEMRAKICETRMEAVDELAVNAKSILKRCHLSIQLHEITSGRRRIGELFALPTLTLTLASIY